MLRPNIFQYVQNFQMFQSSIYPSGNQITSQKMKFSIKDFFSNCDQIRWTKFTDHIWSHLLKKSLMENIIFFVQWIFPDLLWQICQIWGDGISNSLFIKFKMCPPSLILYKLAILLSTFRLNVGHNSSQIIHRFKNVNFDPRLYLQIFPNSQRF